jgi:radical SAM protein with 4Fe4S-binding SPASM domain
MDQAQDQIHKKIESKMNFYNNAFFVWVYATDACNCRCSYCKQRDVHGNSFMSEENWAYTLDTITKISDKHKFSKMIVYVSGGEPMMAFDKFKDVTATYHKVRPDIQLWLTSNFTILPDEAIRWIIDNDVITTASIDGFDMSKPLVDGSNSIDAQVANIERLYAAGGRVGGVQTILDPGTKSLKKLADFVIDHNIAWRMLPPTTFTGSVKTAISIFVEAIDYLIERGYDPAKYDFMAQAPWVQNRFCICGRNLICVLPDLTVSPCNGPLKTLLGKFDENVLDMLATHKNNRIFRNEVMPNFCLDCELEPTCHGGCKLNDDDLETKKKTCEILRFMIKYMDQRICGGNGSEGYYSRYQKC